MDNAFRRSFGYYPSVTLGVKSEHWRKQVFYLRLCKTGNVKLLTEQGFVASHLTCEGRDERSGGDGGDQRFRLNIHLRKLRVRQKRSTVVEYRAVGIFPVLLNERNVVKVAVVIEEKRIDLKDQSKIFGEMFKSREPGCLLGKDRFVRQVGIDDGAKLFLIIK